MTFAHEFAYHQIGRVPQIQHRHTDGNTLELIQVLDGGGNALIGDKTYALHAGTLLFIDAAHIHAINPQNSTAYCRNKLIIDKSVFRQILHTLCDTAPLRVFDEGGSCFLPDQAQAAEIDSIFSMLHNTAVNGGLVLNAVLQLIRSADMYASAAAPQTDSRINDVLRYLNTHYAEPLTVEQIAAETLLSKYYLCHLFRAHTGITVMQYLNEQRLSSARHLLVHTDRSIAGIAQDCGFGSSSHFCTVFRAREGISPREFRVAHQK